MKADLRLSDRIYICKECGNEMHRDINASINILNRALESFELGINSLDYKQQALCVS
ncbi:zinc ribbon domain-containing protein [Campylobacter coli]